MEDEKVCSYFSTGLSVDPLPELSFLTFFCLYWFHLSIYKIIRSNIILIGFILFRSLNRRSVTDFCPTSINSEQQKNPCSIDPSIDMQIGHFVCMYMTNAHSHLVIIVHKLKSMIDYKLKNLLICSFLYLTWQRKTGK